MTASTPSFNRERRRAIALLLHAHCRPADAPVLEPDLDRTLDAAVQLLAHPDPPTAAFQTRTGLSALELDRTGRHAARVLDSLFSVARLDAYAARDALHHPVAASALDDRATDALNAVIATAGLGSGVLSAHHQEALTGAVGHAETELERLLQAEPDPS
ncbi:hypothetical protein ACFVT5_40460 [Streptomyces sp. NPDC058001]|uniref:hypothetical protein n=1 Tax=Streptomyces sp. NPDC058001 TaxID=3346300 RepID=UPI0036E33441